MSARPTWVEISLARLAANCRAVKQLIGTDTQLMAVVKADAYGHGAPRCAQVLAAAGADWFGVALIEEALELRADGITQPIFCLGGAWPEQAETVIRHQLTPALFTIESAAALNHAAQQSHQTLAVHLKVDTGMGRYGVPLADLPAFLDAFSPFEHLRIDGLMTHLANADDADHAHTNQQIAAYQTAWQMMRARGYQPTWQHLANSAAAHGHATARGNLVRVGALLYGLTGDVLQRGLPDVNVQPVLSLHSRIAFLKTVPAGVTIGYGATFTTTRTSRIATIPIGYADGYRRDLSNRGVVLIRGARAPIVGRVSMDLTMVDATDIPAAAFGDEVVLLGEQGAATMRAEELAALLDTVSYEVVTGISARVPHLYRS
ncbi:MAG: alanine racemase [Acidobacteria bacterium]|nr:alanine racemase [Acidobacteriota bacterium]